MTAEEEEFIQLMRADSYRSSMEVCSKLLLRNPEWMPLVRQEILLAEYPLNFRASYSICLKFLLL